MALNLEKAVIGIEFGSTIIKAVLIDENHVPVASGSHGWENQLVDGVWTYCLLYTSPSPRDSRSSRMPSSA